MKVFIALAVLSVAFAHPFEAIKLPQAPAPALEMAVELPKAALPAFEIPDIMPMIIPQEVMEALLAAAPVDINDLADAVIVVDHVVEEVDPVRVVEVAENNAAEVPLDLSPVEDTPVSAVIVVDHFDLSENAVRQEEVDPVHVVDVAAESEVAEESAVAEESEVAEESAIAEESDIVPEPVHFVDAPIEAESNVVDDQLTVKVVDAPIYSGKIFDNPMLR